MTKKQLLRLAAALASARGEMSVFAFEELIARVAEVCAEANPAFSFQAFRAVCIAQPFVGVAPRVGITPKDQNS